jgi:hypothetical protein
MWRDAGSVRSRTVFGKLGRLNIFVGTLVSGPKRKVAAANTNKCLLGPLELLCRRASLVFADS